MPTSWFAALTLWMGTELVRNGSFEAPPGENGALSGWTIEVGAHHGANLPVSRVETDAREPKSGAKSLHLSGDASVRSWRMARQSIEVRPGGTYTLRAFARTADVRQEVVKGTAETGKPVTQYANAFVGLFFYDDAGRVLARRVAQPRMPTAPWEAVAAELAAPESTARVDVCAFLSMSGDLWIDDVAVTITGGKAPPAPEVLLSEDFEKARSLPQGWVEELGASNGSGGARSSVAIDATRGCEGSPRSLHLSGDERTKQWWLVGRTLEVRPGDALTFEALVTAKDVRKEGAQFPNFHLNLSFVDAQGRTLGPLVAQSCGTGTFDWKPVTVEALAPAGAVRVRAGAFLSMSGDAWIDRVRVTRRAGQAPAYDGWVALESRHVVVRHPADHPGAAQMREYAARLDAAYESSRRRLGVAFDDKVTVYLYADKEQGLRFTGRPLAFASPGERAVHQTMENTIGHELTHVVALGIGYAQVPLFGEGVAVWLDGDTDDLHHERAAELLAAGKLPTLGTLLSNFRDDESVTYPAAGSFCGFVITTCGIEAFRRVYVAPDPVASAPSTLGKSLETLDAEWRAFLASRKK